MLSTQSQQKLLLSIRVPEELKQKTQDAAAADRRSVSNWLCLILEQRYANKQAA
jgi:predicted HicB family RNase H-like nuclease